MTTTEPTTEELLDLQIAQAESAKRRRFNPYRAVMGKMPTQKEMSAWSSDRWLDLFRFALIFIEKNLETGDEVFKINEEKRRKLEEYLTIPDHPFQELIYRIDLWLDTATNRQFYYKFTTLTRICFTYLKKHPALIDENMKIIIDAYPKRLGWVLSQYKVVSTPQGDIVQRDGMTMDGNKTVPITLPSIQAKLMNSMVKMADMYEILAGSIDKKDIEKMNVTEKLKALKDLGFIFTLATKKQQTNHLTQININTKDARGAEEAMLDYINKTHEK